MAGTNDFDDAGDEEDVLGRADALLGRHRAGAITVTDADTLPTLTEAISTDLDAAAIPTLTDIVAVPAAAAAHAEPAAAALVVPRADHAPAQRGEVISRVQAQNIEHGIYQKLKQGLDAQIVDALQNRFMPDVAGALDSALRKISADLKADINAMVRTSIEETLHHQLKQLRLTDESRPAQPTAAAEATV